MSGGYCDRGSSLCSVRVLPLWRVASVGRELCGVLTRIREEHAFDGASSTSAIISSRHVFHRLASGKAKSRVTALCRLPSPGAGIGSDS